MSASIRISGINATVILHYSRLETELAPVPKFLHHDGGLPAETSRVNDYSDKLKLAIVHARSDSAELLRDNNQKYNIRPSNNEHNFDKN